ncbi:GntR family transcriptional regulator [Pseudooceanicola sp. LIPI14-2-Ac024]|uniref:GntR family transcriptional regulator n=1 Tax=Pseudooceanicola sp. LIPI14-2-Ac024 TaxID=3344875 RepID=UPI0035CFFEE0
MPETKPGDLPSLFNARCYAEGALAALAATRAKPEHIAGLDRVCTQMERWPEISRGELNKLNTAFHDAIRDIAANRYLAGFRDQVMFHHWQLRMPVMFTDAQIVVSHQEHRAILAGIKAGDPDAAERAARAHVNTTRAIVIEVLESMAASRAAAGAQDPSSILNL